VHPTLDSAAVPARPASNKNRRRNGWGEAAGRVVMAPENIAKRLSFA